MASSAATTQILIQHKLIERHSLHKHATGAVRPIDQFEVTLKQTVFAWGTMNRNISIIELAFLSVLNKREVILVNLSCCSIRQFHMPIISLDIGNINIIALLVEEGVESLCRAQ